MKAILAKDADAITDADREILRQYTGEGGLSSGTYEALNQHFTDYPSIRAIYRALRAAGVTMRRMLEPGAGAGNFVGHHPDGQWTTVDIDETNYKVLQALYPDAEHYHLSYEDFTAKGYDVVICNVPFLEMRGAGRSKARSDIKALHDFYFIHSLDRLKDNGVMAFITSKGTMDKVDSSIRREIVSKADVIGAFRLPGGHFAQNAHTDVITDIIFLQKRPEGVAARESAAAHNAQFVNSTKTADGIALNEYYQSNPDAVLGTMVAGVNKLYGGKAAYEIHGEADLDAISIRHEAYEANPGDRDGPSAPKSPPIKQGKSKGPKALDPPARMNDFHNWAQEHGYFTRTSDDGLYGENIVIIDGNAYASAAVVQFTDTQQSGKVYLPVKGEIAAKMKILDELVRKVNAFQDGDDDAGSAGYRLILAYQSIFSGVHPSKDKALVKFFKEHGEEAYLAELASPIKADFSPADSLTEQTKFSDSGRIKAEKTDDLRTRAIASEDNKGQVQIDHDNDLISESEIEALLDSGYAIVSADPGGSMIVQNDILYYSGNVYKKLEAVAELRSSLPEYTHKYLDAQADRLREVMPERKTAGEIRIRGTEHWMRRPLSRVGVRVTEKVNNNGLVVYDLSSNLLDAEEESAVNRYINNKVLVDRDDGESSGWYMRRVREAEDARFRGMERIMEAIVNDPQAKAAVEDAYNARFRNYVKPDYSAAQYLIQDVLDEIKANAPEMRDAKTGKKIPFQLRKNQVNWVIQALYEGKGINAHDVGGGKTMAAIVLARAMKRRGQANKPLFVVPAKTIKKWIRETTLLFPNAKVVDLGSLSAINRKKALISLANTNADYVYISHEGFEKIKLPAEKEGEYIRAIIDEHVDDPNAKNRQKALIEEKAKGYIKALSEDGRDTRVTWDKLGIDSIIADEAHAFKNMGVNSQLVRYGIGKAFAFSADGKSLKSNRAYDFRIKANYVSDNNNDSNIFLLTATPTPNAPMEIYTMLRHLGTRVFEDYGITNDRQFASMFFDLGTAHDQSTNQTKSVLRAIINATDLRGLLNRFVDKLSMEDMPWIDVPQADEQRVLLDRSDGYDEIATDLLVRKSGIGFNPGKGEDTLLAIYTGARSGSLDPRLYGGPHANVDIDFRSYDAQNDKVQAVIESTVGVAQSNANAGQLIFLDSGGNTRVDEGRMDKDLYAEIKSSLVALGMDPRTIAIVTGSVITNPNTGKETGAGTNSAQKKMDVQDAYNEGRVKVMIGSTTSMGEGMDLQVKTTDIYHLDVPFTPGAIRQRNGRGVRPGNENSIVRIHYFLMRGTFDSSSFDLVRKKRGWNEAIWDKDAADTISTEEEMVAGVMPDSRRIMIELEQDPLVKKQLEVQFTLAMMEMELDSVRAEFSARRSRAISKRITLDEKTKRVGELREELRQHAPDERIKSDEKRQEQFDAKKASLEKRLASTEAKIEEHAAAYKELQEKQTQAEDDISTLHAEIAAYRERWYSEETGNINVTEADIELEGGGADVLGFAASPGGAMGRERGRETPATTRDALADESQAGTPETKDAKLLQAVDVARFIKTAWPELSVKKATTHRKKNPGWYSRILGEIRMKKLGDIPVLIHELGHHFDRQLNKWSNTRSISVGIRDELTALGRDLYGNKRPHGGYKSEGFAEFIRIFLTGDASEAAPNLYNWFTGEYLPSRPDEAAKINELGGMIAAIRDQSSAQTVRAFWQPMKKDMNPQRMLLRAWSDFERKWVNINSILSSAMADAGIDRSNLDPGNDPFMVATANSRRAPAAIYHTLMRETRNLQNEVTGESLQDALKDVLSQGGKITKQWIDYAVALRALNRYHAKGIDPGISQADAQNTVDQYHSEQFADTVRRVTEWSRRVLHLMVESGAMTQAEYNKIVEVNGDVYLPFARQFMDDSMAEGRKGKGKAVTKIKKGGSEPIHNPVDMLMVGVQRIMQAAFESDFKATLVRLYDSHGTSENGMVKGLAKLMAEVPAPLNATTFRADQIKMQIAEIAIKLGADPGVVADAVADDWNAMMTVYKPATDYNGPAPIEAITIGGKTRFFQFDPQVHKMVAAMNRASNPSGLLTAIRSVSQFSIRTARIGATGTNWGWILHNAPRDAFHVALTADHSSLGPFATLAGIYDRITDSDALSLYRWLGIDLSGWIGQDKYSLKKMSRELSSVTPGQKALYNIQHPIQLIQAIGSDTEIYSRIREFKNAHRHALEQGWDARSAGIYAAVAGKDITTDYTRAGEWGVEANSWILFFGAVTQCVDKSRRTFRDHPIRTLARGMGWISFMSLMQYFRNREEDWWKELPPEMKWSRTYWKLPNGQRFYTKLPFDMGVLFGGIPAAMIEERRNPGAARQAISVLLKGMNPARMPHLLGPPLEVAKNENWMGRSIVPRYAETRLPEDQYTDQTTKLAIEFSRMLSGGAKIVAGDEDAGFSPAKVEHLINGYTGGLYRQIATTIDSMMDSTRVDKEDWSTLPLVGTFFLRMGMSNLTDGFYQRMDSLERRRGSDVATLEELGELVAHRRLSREFGDVWSERRKVMNAASNVGEARPEATRLMDGVLSAIRDLREVSPEEHRKIGIGRTLYDATSPSAPDDAKQAAQRLLAGVPRAELISALRGELEHRQGSARKGPYRPTTMNQSGGLTSYGERLREIRRLGLGRGE